MKIVVDINHPAHVHLFKNFIWEMKKRRHDVIITASEKNIAYDLLDNYGFKYTKLGSYGSSILKMIVNIPIMDYRMYRAIRSFNPDIFIGLGSIRSAHVAHIINKPSIIVEDSEHTKLQNWLYRPFSEVILSSFTFKGSYGKKHLKYAGFDELAYLHPRYFTPHKELLEKMNLKPYHYVIIRFISWNASHDVGQKGFDFQSVQDMSDFISFIENHGYKVLISSEEDLPLSLHKYSINLPPEDIHDLLYFAYMYIGEGATMAAEAAVLGTPSVYVSSIPLGYINELKQRYGLIYTCIGYEEVIDLIKQLLQDNALKEKHKEKREKLLAECVDPTEYMVSLIESYAK